MKGSRYKKNKARKTYIHTNVKYPKPKIDNV